jgi:hypothetical protein
MKHLLPNPSKQPAAAWNSTGHGRTGPSRQLQPPRSPRWSRSEDPDLRSRTVTQIGFPQAYCEVIAHLEPSIEASPSYVDLSSCMDLARASRCWSCLATAARAGWPPASRRPWWGSRTGVSATYVKQSDLHVHLRIGTYFCAGWNFGYTPTLLSLADYEFSVLYNSLRIGTVVTLQSMSVVFSGFPSLPSPEIKIETTLLTIKIILYTYNLIYPIGND